MKVKVLYFASIKEKLGKEIEEFELEEGVTLGSLIDQIKLEYKSIAKFLEGRFFSYAVNQEIADKNIVLKPGDEIAILPPLSGG